MKKAVVMQMIVNVVDKDRESNSAPELLDIRLGVCSMLTDGVDDFCVGVFGRFAHVHAEQCCRGDVHESAPGRTIESTDESDRDAVTVDEPCWRSVDSRRLGELHGQDLALGDGPLVMNAGKLTDVKGALGVDDGTFRSQPAERGSPAAQVSQ